LVQYLFCKSNCITKYEYYKYLHCCIGCESRYKMWHVATGSHMSARRITKWLHMNNSYLALLTRSCKPECHVGKKSTWHDFNHDQDTGFKRICRKDVTMSNWIGFVSDLLWHLFLDSFLAYLRNQIKALYNLNIEKPHQ